MLNYLTAPNIRHKVKHPLFLSIKFSNTVKLYYNKSQCESNTAEQILEKLQMKLTSEHIGNTNGTTSTKMEEKSFIMHIIDCQDAIQYRKV